MACAIGSGHRRIGRAVSPRAPDIAEPLRAHINRGPSCVAVRTSSRTISAHSAGRRNPPATDSPSRFGYAGPDELSSEDLERLAGRRGGRDRDPGARRPGPPHDHLDRRRRRRGVRPLRQGPRRPLVPRGRRRTPPSRSTSTGGGSPATAIPATDPDSIERVSARLPAQVRRRSAARLDARRPESSRRRSASSPPDPTRVPSCTSTSSSTSCRTSTRTRPASGSASFDQLVEQEGESRARFLVYKLLKRARQLHVGLPPLTQTRYINTISPEQEPFFPGDEQIELRIRRIIRWNAVAMVLRANNRFTGIGGHLATYASAASLYEVGFNHFFRGKDDGQAGDQVFYQGHAAPGIYARAFLEGRLTEDQLDHFRRETRAGRGPAVVPASAAHAGLLGVPDGLDGPRADQRDLPGPVQPLPPEPRPARHVRARASGRSSATARPTSPSRSARSTSPRARASTT